MLAAIFDIDLDIFDFFTLAGAILLVIAGWLARPTPTPPRAAAWATTVAYFGLAVFAFGFLWLTP